MSYMTLYITLESRVPLLVGGWLVGWLVGWMVGWLVGWLAWLG